MVDSDGALLHVTITCEPLRSSAECIRLSTELDTKCDCDTQAHDHGCVHRTHAKHNGSVFKKRLRIVVPKSLQPSVLYHFHGAGGSNHLGIAAMKSRVKKDFYWSGINEHCRRWVKACLQCAMRKRPRPQNVVLPGVMKPPSRPWETVAIDFSGPYPETLGGNKWVLTMICCFSRYPICVPLPSRHATLVASAILDNLLQYFPRPKFVVTDNGQELIGHVLRDVLIQALSYSAYPYQASHTLS